ncbi:hypothetical protein BKG79_22390 [Mycobacteroides chelonae]|uniref:hypothetical protein n=1 Tax=Mycobacteroides chelonae TaxID=1774 RepID=UPI0008A9C3C2|nr:hypothetical protein [Mycobacteroides chelonae]OHU33354.1 hypothetical protein BKG79_22390 [Mycobacteroides chelonae]
MPPRFTEVWIPFSLSDLPEADSLPLSDTEAFIPYLTQRWPPSGRPHRVELRRDGRPNPKGTDGWLVFRIPPPAPEESGKRKVAVDWAQVRPKPPTKDQKKQ